MEALKQAATDAKEALAKTAIEALSPEQQRALVKGFCEKLSAASVSGGADKAPDLQSYAQMLYSKSKEKVIRAIAEDALKALGLGKTENAQRVKIDVIIKKLKEYVPDPQQLAKYGPKFYKSVEEQKRVCDVFAQAINKQYGGVIISSNIPVNERCKQVSEVLHSLIAGMNSEFLGVAADVNRILNNINVVGEVLDSTYNKILSFLDKAEDDELKQYAKTYRQLYSDVKAEFDRQQAILANLMNNTITPAKGEIVKLLQENPDFKGLVDDLEQQIGTEGFGRKLASLVSNASGVVYAAEQVDKAIKKIGLSLEQLKSAKDMKDLHAKVVKAIMAKKPDTDELDAMMKAVKVLFENSYNQNEIIEQLSKTKRGAGNKQVEDLIESNPANTTAVDAPHSASTSDVSSDSEAGFPLENKEGGAVIGADNFDEEGKELPPYFRKQSLKKKISDKEKQRKLMFGQFRTLLRDTYNNIISHATQLGPLVGNEIPMSDELEKFINLFSELPALDKENIHIALTGYRKDLVSREQRENFLNEYALVAQSIEPLVSGPHGSIFNGLKHSIEEMIKVVDNFTQTMIKPLTEIHVESPQEVLEKVRNMAARIYTGSGASDREPFMAGDWTTFNRIKLELKYFYSLSIFRKNMAARAQDNQEYAADYVRVLGEESGWLINKINAEFNDLIEKGNPEAKLDLGAKALADLSPGEQVYKDLKVLGDDKKAVQVYRNLKLIWTNQQAAKVGMVKAAQAIDLYLKAFTKGIAKDPDSVKSIAAMLDGIQFVAKWFIERSGDNLANLMEVPNNLKIIQNEKGNLVNSETEHYYQKANPANPFSAIDLSNLTEKEVENLMRFTDKTLKSTRALENILSVFISVGDKFKDVQPSSETFMNAGQLQNALIDYMRVTAFSCCLKGKPSGNTGFAAIPDNSNFWAYHAWDKRDRHYDTQGWEDAFYDTDLLFLMTVKSIVAKVFTVVDAYRLFNRPTKNRALISSLSPVRTVLGGGAAPVKIIPEAVELYFRLPLLAEWYRDKLGFNSLDENPTTDPDEWVLALVPNIDGIWSDLFAVIFDKARQIKEGNYTEGQSRDIIEAVNVCYKAYRTKYPKASCRDIIQAFINEVNRAYGYIQQKQVSAFVSERHKNLDSAVADYNEVADPQQYDILNSDNQFKPGPAPSDKFVDVNIKNAKTVRRITMQKLQKKMVDLHNELDLEFLTFVLGNDGLQNEMFSFKDTISNYKKELSLAKSDEQQYQIVLRALQNTERELVYNSDKMIIIQEMLNAPLAILNAIYYVLYEINALLIAGSYDGFDPTNFKHMKRSKLMSDLMAYSAVQYNGIKSTKYSDGTTGEVEVLIRLLGLLSDIAANKIPLVGISIAESGKINLDFNKIGEFAKGLVADLRSNLIKVKSMFIKREEIEYFEKYESTQYQNSIRSIEEILIEILINDRDECGLPTACSKYLNQTLESYANKQPELCNSALRALIYYEDRIGSLPNVFSPANLSVFPFNIIALRRPTGAELKEDKQALNRIAVSNQLDAKAYGADIAKTDKHREIRLDIERINSLLQAPSILFESPNTLNSFNIGSHFTAAYNPNMYLNSNCIRPITTKSLFFSINKFIHMYLQSNMLNSPDPKLYAPLIEAFMNSAASREILEGKPFPNVRNLATTLGLDPNIQNRYVLAYCGSAPYDTLRNGDTNEIVCKPAPAGGPVPPPAGAPPPAGPVPGMAPPPAGAPPVIPGMAPGPLPPPGGRPRAGIPPVPTVPLPPLPAGRPLPPLPTLSPMERALLNARLGLRNVDQKAIEAEKAQRPKVIDPIAVAAIMKMVNSRSRIAENDAKRAAFNETGLTPEDFKSGGAALITPDRYLYGVDKLVQIDNKTLDDKTISLGCIPESPQENSLLYASTALTIKSLMYSMNLDKTKKRYLFDGLADIPAHLKEKMQINLPMFSKMFQSVIDRTAFFKKFITYNVIGNKFKQQIIKEVAIKYHEDDPNRQYATLKKVSGNDNAQMRSYLLALLNKINDLAVAIKKCCDGVYNELNDKLPYFMELRKDGVAEYKHKTGHYPFAPASFMLLPLIQHAMPSDEDYSGVQGILLPSNINGSYAYQLNNGLRVVYNNPNAKFNIEHFPSVKELYNAYIAAFDIGKKISSSEYVSVLEKIMLGSKFCNEIVQADRLFNVGTLKFDLGLNSNGWFNQPNLNPPSGSHATYPVLALRHAEDTINKIIELQDVVDLRVVKEEMVRFIGTPTNKRPGRVIGDARKELRLYNILDMQISPINFSAFMREIPYTNLINYAYTFDRMTHDFIMPDYLSSLGTVALTKDNVLISATAQATSVKQVLIKFLLHPYAQLDVSEYLLLLYGVFAGMNDFGIGRPKFLNDQIFSKVLLTSPYNAILSLLTEMNKGVYADNNDYKVQALRTLSNHIATGIKAPSGYDPQNNLYVLKDNKMLTIPMKPADLPNWEAIGKSRFDTKLVRNIVWLVTLQLVMRHSITKHLSWIDTPVIRGLKLLDHKITEFDGNKTLAKDEFDSGDYENILE